MRIGAFEIDEPVPELNHPHALVTIRPWVDVGRVGRHTLIRLERAMDAKELGKLARPGNFYDFTRYRPRIMNVGVERRLSIPNTTVLYAVREEPPDFLFFHLLEPHSSGEDYVDSAMELLNYFHVERYVQIGGVSDAVPHTRPLQVGGVVPEEQAKRFGILQSKYEGPTSITSLIIQEASRLGIETMNFLAHLPHYSQLDEDYSGVARLLEILCGLYDLPTDLIDSERGHRQYQKLDAAVARNPQARTLVQHLEANYDTKVQEAGAESPPPLAPEVEKFLLEMDKRLGLEGD